MPTSPCNDFVVDQWTWKTPEMSAMAVAVLRLALARGLGEMFSALDLPTHGQRAHGGSGIAGTVFGLLARKYGILAPVGGFVDGVFQQRYVKNACGNRIGVWRLADPARARALLAKHDREFRVAEYQPMELFGT